MIKPEPRKKGPVKTPPDKPQPLPEGETWMESSRPS